MAPNQGRVQVPDLQNVPALRPQATPVDTYAAPAAPPNREAPATTNGLIQLSQSLSKLNPVLSNLVSLHGQSEALKEKEQAKIDEAKGSELAAQYALESQNNFNTFKKQHPELASQVNLLNPWVSYGFNKYVLKNKTRDFGLQLRTAWVNSPERNSNDPADFQKWLGNQTQGFFKGLDQSLDPRLLNDTVEQVQQTADTIAGEQVTYRQKQMYDNLKEQVKTNIAGLVADNFGRVPNDDLAQTLATTNADAISHGMDPTDANEMTTAALVDIAKKNKNVDILKLADKIKTGTGYLGRTANFIDKSNAAEDAIISAQDKEYRFADFLEKNQREKQSTKILTDIGPTLMDNPSDPKIDAAIRNLRGIGNFADANALEEQQHKHITQPLEDRAKVYEDSNVSADLLRGVYAGKTSVIDIAQARQNKLIGNDTAQYLTSMLQRKEAAQDTDNEFKGTHAKAIGAIEGSIKEALKPDFGFEKSKANEAASRFYTDIEDFKEEGIKKTGQVPSRFDIEDFARTDAQNIIKDYQGQQGGTTFTHAQPKPAPAHSQHHTEAPKAQSQPKPVQHSQPAPKPAPAAKPAGIDPNKTFKSKKDIIGWGEEYNKTGGKAGRLSLFMREQGIPVNQKNATEVLKRLYKAYKGK